MPRTFQARAFSLSCLSFLLLFAGAAHALQVTGIQAENKRGQTYITWNNLPGTGWTYHIYASISEVRTMADFLTYAWEIGAVGDSSAMDRRISTLLGETLAFRTDSAAAPLSLTRGLFVNTPTETGLTHYVILAENATYPIAYSFLPGQNTTVQPVWEVLAIPRPVWQRTIANPPCEDYVLFASANGMPGFPAMWGREGHARHFGLIKGAPGGALVLHGHGHGGNFLNAMVGTRRPGETVIAPDDYLPSWDASSFYLGYNSSYDPEQGWNYPASGGWVVDYTDQFVLHLMDWAQLTYGTDPNRVYAMGSSMGGSFAFFLAWHHPERIAAAWANIPKTCAAYKGDTQPTLTATFERMWSPISVNLPVVDGTPVYEYMDGRFLAARHERRGAAPVFGFVGRNDNVVGWQEKIPLFEALDQYRAGGAWFWDERTHFENQNLTTWSPEQLDWQQLYRYRLDRSFPALSNCTADSDPGDGSAGTGVTVGTVNGFVQWDEEIVDMSHRWEVVLRPRALRTRDGVLQPPAGFTVDVTPRRLQAFAVSNRTSYRYTVTDVATGEFVTGGLVDPDGHFLLTVPLVPVRPGGSRLVLEPVTTLDVDGAVAVRAPRVALAANPVRGATSLRVDWPADGEARVDLLDLAGRRASTLFSGAARGASTVTLDPAGLAPGVYLVLARQGELRATRRVVVIR